MHLLFAQPLLFLRQCCVQQRDKAGVPGRDDKTEPIDAAARQVGGGQIADVSGLHNGSFDAVHNLGRHAAAVVQNTIDGRKADLRHLSNVAYRWPAHFESSPVAQGSERF